MNATAPGDAAAASDDPAAADPAPDEAFDHPPPPNLRTGPERRWLGLALLFSGLIHALLLSLVFGGQAGGLPGLGLPWQERRIEVPDLRIVLLPPPAGAVLPVATPSTEPVQSEPADAPPLANGLALPTALPPVPTPGWTPATDLPAFEPRAEPEPAPGLGTPSVAALVKPPLSADPPTEPAPPPNAEPTVTPLTRPGEFSWVMPAAPVVSKPAVMPAPSASSPETTVQPPRTADDAAQLRIAQEARERAAELAERERALLAAQVAAAEAARQAAIRQDAARADATRLEAERLESARQAAALQEVSRQAVARQEAAQQEAGRVEAVRIEAAQAAAAKREALLRAIGQQLNEEADRRDAASAGAHLAPPLAPSSSSARRGRLFGRTDPNADLILYAEAWSRKIQLNMAFDLVRDLAKQPHADPLVTVALRSDGSVESVSFVRASGVAALDDAIRRMVHSQAPYPAFPPGLAREFDVIEVRRTWYFDMAIRLY